MRINVRSYINYMSKYPDIFLLTENKEISMKELIQGEGERQVFMFK